MKVGELRGGGGDETDGLEGRGVVGIEGTGELVGGVEDVGDFAGG